MAEFEWKKQLGRAEAATILRQIADGLEDGGEVELEQDSWELKLEVPEELEFEVELEVSSEGVELEIELKWSEGSGDDEESEESGDDETLAGGEARA